MIDPVEFGKQIGGLIREAVAPLEARIKELEAALEASETLDVAEVVTQVLDRPELKTLVDLQAAESIVNYFTENPVQHGKDGANGENGSDGVGLAGAVIDRDGELVVTKTNGEAIKLGRVIGHDGQKGADGKDGADFSEVEFDYDGERGLIIRGDDGVEIVKRLPIPIDRGYYREGMKCEKADVVTEAGSAWIALKDTDTKPTQGNDAWRMFARKGRDGERGEKGAPYVPPAPVKLGNPNG